MRARIRSLEASLALVQQRESTLVAENASLRQQTTDSTTDKTAKVEAAVAQLEHDAVERRTRAFADARRVAQLRARVGQKGEGMGQVVDVVLVRAVVVAVDERRGELDGWRERSEGLEAQVREAQAEDERRLAGRSTDVRGAGRPGGKSSTCSSAIRTSGRGYLLTGPGCIAGVGAGVRGLSSSTFGTSAGSAGGSAAAEAAAAREMEQAAKAAQVLAKAVKAVNARIDGLRAENCKRSVGEKSVQAGHVGRGPEMRLIRCFVWRVPAALVMQLAGC